MTTPLRGDIWRVGFDPVEGHEQGGVRPGLVVSTNGFNSSLADLVVIIPLTTKARPLRSFVPVHPPEGGLRQTSYVICDQIRTVSKHRLSKLLGSVHAATLQAVEDRLRILLDLT